MHKKPKTELEQNLKGKVTQLYFPYHLYCFMTKKVN